MTLLARRVSRDDWRPIGVKELEKSALDVVRSEDSRSVIAGPGAGKTELLAQRAAYLLQTGLAPSPQRILAISFKRDAAANLATRVRKRCHRSHADRLDSLTFDAFAKSIVDRFGQALPERWRPRPDYDILSTNDKLYRGFLEQIASPPPDIGTRADLNSVSPKTFERVYLLGSPLPVDGWSSLVPAQWAADRFWQSALHEGKRTYLSFPMIGRLAELLLRINPMVRDALRLTYSHLFMDEFQDTTQTQYDLVKTIFLHSNSIITAVGDNKQQIMRWALAMDDPFGALEADFGARRTSLLNNYRSSPDLVRIQHVLAQALDKRAVAPVSKTEGSIAGDSCAIWDFSTPAKEAQRLADFVLSEMTTYNLAPRDFVLLVRQKADDYAAVIEPAFRAVGISLRNEAGLIGKVALQELLTEDASRVLLYVLRLAAIQRGGRHWSTCLQALATLHRLRTDDEVAHDRLARNLDAFATALFKDYAAPPSDKAAVRALVDRIFGFVGLDKIVAAYPAYAQGDWLAKVIESAAHHLWTSCSSTSDWTGALDAYEGVHAVPLMTIHKSKGLEYHTVVFVGLDDGAWWSFTGDQVEGTAGFFVAFTRAKQRVVFTYCAQRGARSKIKTLYELLKAAGVKAAQVE
ncbi:ATPase AAA [Burkholderia sp. K24]|jgi:superfamily I DNA/RNA helicase|nr:ATPase AAA [Burkholderia sp. K24]